MQRLTIEQMHEYCDEEELSVSIFPGYDDAIIGLATQGHRDVAIYDYDRLISVMMAANEWSMEDAQEWYSFNMTGYQEGAPVVLEMKIVPPPPEPREDGEGHGTG